MTWEEKIFYERLDAKKEGKLESIIELLEEHGAVPDVILEKMYMENNLEQMKKWLKLAAKVDSIEEFIEKMSGDNM